MQQAINLIKAHEGLRLQAYRCPAGVWTIGYGHTTGVRPGQVITAGRADQLLLADLTALAGTLDSMQRAAGISLPANRRSALLSFAFNVGINALRGSILWRKVVANQSDPTIAAEFARWKYAAGRVMPGLVARRAAESVLYFAQ